VLGENAERSRIFFLAFNTPGNRRLGCHANRPNALALLRACRDHAAAPPSSVMNERRLTRSPRRRGRAAFGGTPRPSALAVVRSMTRSNFVEARRMLCAIPADLPSAWFPAPSDLAPIRAMYALMFGHFARSILWILVQLSTVNR